MDVKKIVIIGGESTGKSTLCSQLATHFQTSWVEEYARDYLEKLNRPYVETDLIAIAKGQLALEDKKLKQAIRFLFCDTDLHVIKVWSEHKYKRFDPSIEDLLLKRKYDAYIITSPDIPWVDDPLREHPQPELRTYFFNWYKKLIIQTGIPYCIVDSDEDTRLQQSIAFLTRLAPASIH